YPMFYYNLACVFAEREKLDDCIDYLAKAIKLKDHILADESFPDPSKDDSFQRFLKEEKFIKLLKDNSFLPTLNEVDAEWNEYSNKEYGYSMIFPKSWSFSIPNEMYHVVRCEFRKDTSRQDSEGSLRVMISSANGNGSLEDYATAAMKVYELIGKDIYVNKKERIVNNGSECLIYDFTYSYKNGSFPNRQRTITYYYSANGKIYNVNYMGDSDFYNKNMDLIQKSLKSFKLVH
ncbi:MAG: PsbP-related protein, partial [Ignavibacteriales bacterium]